MNRLYTRLRGCMLLVCWLPAFALAEVPTWPNKPVQIIVPFPAGGGTDVVARQIASKLSERLGQPFIIDNRPGAGGTLGSALVAKATADGYTLGVATTSTHAVSVSVHPKLAYDPLKDFVAITTIGVAPFVLVINPEIPATTLPELVAYLQKNAGQLNYASVGQGTVSHLVAERFKALTKTDVLHVPYKGAAQTYPDLIAGRVSMLFDNPIALAAHVRSGRMRAIAQTEKNVLLPDTPLFRDVGLPGLDAELWYGFVAPVNTPPEVVKRLQEVLSAVISEGSMRKELLAKGVTPLVLSPDEFTVRIRRDIDQWGQIAKATGTYIQ